MEVAVITSVVKILVKEQAFKTLLNLSSEEHQYIVSMPPYLNHTHTLKKHSMHLEHTSRNHYTFVRSN